jgi:HlyD family secretion protein
MKKSVKFAIIGAIVLITIVGSVVYLMMPINVRMTEIVLQTAEDSFTEQGEVASGRTVLVFPVAQGEINELYVREGQHIEAGEPLLSVCDIGLQLRLEQVQNGINSLEAQRANVAIETASFRQSLRSTLNSLQGELRALDAQAAQSDRAGASQTEITNEQLRIQQVLIERHENDLQLAEENLARMQILYEGGVVPRIDLDAAHAALEGARTQLQNAQSQMTVIAAGTNLNNAEHFEGIRASLNAQIAGINEQLAQDTASASQAHFAALIAIEEINLAQLQREIANTTLTAPIGGTITTLHAQNTNFVSAAAPIAEITSQESLTIEVYVSTQDTSLINVGDTVGLTLRQRMNDIEFTGTVVEIENTAVIRFTALGVEERKVRVIIAPNIPQHVTLGVGFAVDVSFFVFREENRIVVPRTAVFRDGGRDYVWVVPGANTGTLEQRAVTTGIELRTNILIESGLRPGDFVVNDANNADLNTGTRVSGE